MYNIDLCHLGDNCGPGILIDDILNIHKKCLFMLGIYEFNNILTYLNDNNYEKIYKKEYLTVQPNNNVKHGLYNFIFNHDYSIVNAEISNYEFIKTRFDIKIKNFRDMLIDSNKCIFIVFCDNIDTLMVDEMLNCLSHIKQHFHLIIYTDNNFLSTYTSEHLSIVKLENPYNNWWSKDDNTKYLLYKEIYDTFLQCLLNANIDHNFPQCFAETHYGKKTQ